MIEAISQVSAYPVTPEAGPAGSVVDAVLVECDSLADYGPAVALAAARPELRAVPVHKPPTAPSLHTGAPLTTVHRWVGALSPELRQEWTRWQRLWHRWQAPGDRLPVMRWYLSAVSRGVDDNRINEAVDAVLQELPRLPPQRRAAHVAAFLGLPDDGAMIGHGDVRWALPAISLAAWTGRPLLWCAREELVAAAEGVVGDLTVVGPPDGVSVAEVSSLAASRSFEAAGPRYAGVALPRRAAGFLSPRTPQTLSAVVARQCADHHPAEDPAVGWVMTGLDRDPLVDDDTVLLNRERSAAGYLRAVGDLDLLLISSHSREDLLHLGPDALCGRSLTVDPRPGETIETHPASRLPACMHDGACVKDGEVLPIAELRTPVVMINGCNVLRLGGDTTFDPRFTLPFAYLEGHGLAAVGSRRTRFGDDHLEVLLADRLLRSGRSLGEAVRLVNVCLPYWGRESPDYLVLGDPRLTPLARPPHLPAAGTVSSADGFLSVRWTDVDAPLLEAKLPALDGEPQIRLKHTDGSTADELFHALAPEPDGGWRLFVFSWSRLQARDLIIRIGPDGSLSDVRRDLSTAVDAVESYRRVLRGLVNGFDNAERELSGQAVALGRALAQVPTRSAAWHDADRASAAIQASLDRLDADLLGQLLDRIDRGAYVWLEQYADHEASFRVSEHYDGPACPYCGASTVCRRYEHLWRPARRAFALCVTCGNIWDTDGTLAPVRLEGRSEVRRPGEVTQTIVVANPTDHLLRGVVGVRLYQAGKWQARTVPAQAPVLVPPGGEQRLAVTVHVGPRQPAHMEFLRGFLVSRQRVGVFQKNLWVVPGASRAAAEGTTPNGRP